MLKKSAIPLYHQLKELLTERIEGGLWEPGYQLPAENELASEFGVSRATVRQAMQFLESQGLVERMQGRGTFVGRPKVAHNLLSLGTAEMLGPAVPEMRIIHAAREDAPPSIAAHLGLDKGEPVFAIQRCVLVGAEPLMLITSWLPWRLFPGIEDKALGRSSLRNLLREHYGIEAAHQYKEVEVTILDDDEARYLACPAGAPALLLSYLSSDDAGRAIEFRKLVVRGDRCKYFVNLDVPELLV